MASVHRRSTAGDARQPPALLARRLLRLAGPLHPETPGTAQGRVSTPSRLGYALSPQQGWRRRGSAGPYPGRTGRTDRSPSRSGREGSAGPLAARYLLLSTCMSTAFEAGNPRPSRTNTIAYHRNRALFLNDLRVVLRPWQARLHSFPGSRGRCSLHGPVCSFR